MDGLDNVHCVADDIIVHGTDEADRCETTETPPAL